MYDTSLAIEIVHQILWSTRTIRQRFEPVKSPNDFHESDAGLEKFDAICMQLIAIGESVKNLDKVTDSTLLLAFPAVEWKKIMGMRDIISHHYFDIDYEAVFTVCEEHLDPLEIALSRIETKLKEQMDDSGNDD